MQESKIFNTRMVAGIRAAERYKARLENKYDRVRVYTLGLDRVKIVGSDSRAAG